jgi:hypothetical protein
MALLLQDRFYLHDRHRLSHEQIDAWLVENRSKEFLQEKIKQLEAVKKFLWVTDLIRKYEIPFVSLKGPLLSYRIYEDPTVRISKDIDLLLEVKFVEPVLEILLNNGYQLVYGSLWPQNMVQQELLVNAYHHLALYNKELNSNLELHWILMHQLPMTRKKQTDLIAVNLEELNFANRKFTVLNKEFELLFLLIHGSRHAWSRLKWLVDIKDYLVKEIDMDRFEKLVVLFKARRIVCQANFFLKKYFHTQLSCYKDHYISGHFILFAEQSIDGGIGEVKSTRQIILAYWYLGIMFPGFYYKWKIVTLALFRPNDMLVIDSSFKIIYFLYRPYSFVKRRILNT